MSAPDPVKHTVLLISPEPWSHIFVSKHHFAAELARRGHKVVFLNPPDPAPGASIQLEEPGHHPGIVVVNYGGQPKGMRFLPSIIRRSLNKKFLRQLEHRLGSRIDVIWNFENSRFYDMKFAGSRLKIYHQVDLNQNFHVREAASQSDICFCTSDVIKRQIEPWTRKVFKIHHGVQSEALGHSLNEKAQAGITATYIGNLDIEYLDINLLASLARAFPDVQFKMVGSYSPEADTYKTLSAFPNVIFTGRVNSSAIRSYLDASDILLVCYKAEEYRDQLSSPHKMMEYLASGKIIVATYTDEYKDKTGLLLMSDTNKDYISLFGQAAANLQQYNHPALMKERRDFAKDHTYAKQLDRINALLRDNHLPRFS